MKKAPTLTAYNAFATLLHRDGAESAVRATAETSVSSVEFLEFARLDPSVGALPDRASALRLKALLDEYGLTVACFSVGVGLYSPDTDADAFRLREARLLFYAELAAVLGARYFHHTLATTHDTRASYETVSNAVFPAALRVADRVSALGMTLLYEPQGMYFNGVEGFGRFYRRMKAEHPDLYVCGDVGNPLCVDESPADFFRAFSSDVRHVHLKDYRRTASPSPSAERSKGGAYLEDTVLGTGIVPLTDCLSALRAQGYDGAFAIEHDDPASLASAREILEAHFSAKA